MSTVGGGGGEGEGEGEGGEGVDCAVGAGSRGECESVDEVGALASVCIRFLPLRVKLRRPGICGEAGIVLKLSKRSRY